MDWADSDDEDATGDDNAEESKPKKTAKVVRLLDYACGTGLGESQPSKLPCHPLVSCLFRSGVGTPDLNWWSTLSFELARLGLC